MIAQELLNLLEVSPFLLGLLALFWKGDDHISDKARADLSAYLQSVSPTELSASPWVTTIHQWFERLFGHRHLSGRAIVMSFVLTIGALIVLAVILRLENTLFDATAFGGGSIGIVLAAMVLFALPISLLTDYVSLLTTRIMLRHDGFALHPLRYLLLDLVISFAVFLIAFFIVFNLWASIGNWMFGQELGLINLNPIAFYSGITGALFSGGSGNLLSLKGLSFSVENGLIILPLLTSFTSSIWLWIAGLGSFILHQLARMGSTFRAMQYALPIAEKPVRSLGIAAACIILIAYAFLWLIGLILLPPATPAA